jgi:hypothetical protein
LIQKVDSKENVVEVARELVGVYLLEKKPIVSVNSLLMPLISISNQSVKLSTLRDIFKNDIGLSYRSARPYAVDNNLPIHKHVRVHFCRQLLRLLADGVRVINFDESSYNSSNYTNKTWYPKGRQNNLIKKKLGHSISFIAVVDSTGNSWASLSQGYSNESSTWLQIFQLVLLLDKQDPDWRCNSVLIQDNA